jgi:hypothetical protein
VNHERVARFSIYASNTAVLARRLARHPTAATAARDARNPAVTEIVKIPNRGHSLTIDHGWREVAETALSFINRFT